MRRSACFFPLGARNALARVRLADVVARSAPCSAAPRNGSAAACTRAMAQRRPLRVRHTSELHFLGDLMTATGADVWTHRTRLPWPMPARRHDLLRHRPCHRSVVVDRGRGAGQRLLQRPDQQGRQVQPLRPGREHSRVQGEATDPVPRRLACIGHTRHLGLWVAEGHRTAVALRPEQGVSLVRRRNREARP